MYRTIINLRRKICKLWIKKDFKLGDSISLLLFSCLQKVRWLSSKNLGMAVNGENLSTSELLMPLPRQITKGKNYSASRNTTLQDTENLDKLRHKTSLLRKRGSLLFLIVARMLVATETFIYEKFHPNIVETSFRGLLISAVAGTAGASATSTCSKHPTIREIPFS